MRGAPVASITSRSNPIAIHARLAGMHLRESGEQVLVDRVALAVDALLLVHLGLEAAALFGGIGQLAEAIGQFDPASIKLEPLRHPGIIPGLAGQRGLGHRITVEDASCDHAPDAARSFEPEPRDSMSDHVSSEARDRMPQPAICARKTGGIGSCRRHPPWPKGRSRHIG
jgi:hypothetical protein